MDIISGIYKIENMINHKIYVGQSQDIHKRFMRHKNDLNSNRSFNSHLQRSWNKYGENNFSFEILEVCNIDDLDCREMFWIEKLDAYRNGYNMTVGGGGCRGFKMSEEAREKIKKALTGVKKSESARINLRLAQKKWHLYHINNSSIKVVCLNTKEIFDNSVIAAKAHNISTPGLIRRCCNGEIYSTGILNNERLVWVDYNQFIQMNDEEISKKIYIANNWRSELVVSEETCKKISDALKGKPKSVDAINSVRISLKKWHETHLNPRSIKIVCLNTKKVFNNTVEASAEYDISTSHNIRRCCSGELLSCGSYNGQRLVWCDYEDYVLLTDEDITKKIEKANSFGKNAMNPRAKKIMCTTTGEIFDCIKDASLKYKVSTSNIGACCSGRRKHAAGMEWQYYTS